MLPVHVGEHCGSQSTLLVSGFIFVFHEPVCLWSLALWWDLILEGANVPSRSAGLVSSVCLFHIVAFCIPCSLVMCTNLAIETVVEDSTQSALLDAYRW